MILVFDHFIVTADDIKLLCLDGERVEKSFSQRKLFSPKTWFLPNITTGTYQYQMKIFYRVHGTDHTFIFTADDSRTLQNMMVEAGRQIKAQVKVQNQEMLDTVFENAIKELP